MTAIATHILTALMVVLTASYTVAVYPSRVSQLPARVGLPLSVASTWGYQLQNVRPRAIPDAIDLLVVDNASDGTTGLTPTEVRALSSRPSGLRRTVLAYLSIGEAESYRAYWQPSWSYWKPAWLGPENPNWRGNYHIRFWDPEWQRLIVDAPAKDADFVDKAAGVLGLRAVSCVERIIAAGFDGVYLDRVDAYYQPLEGRPTAKSDMIKFVAAISRYAKMRKPGFLIVAQNGEELLDDPGYRAVIDAVAKEDLLYGIGGDGQPNPQRDVEASLRFLETFKSSGKPVFVVEYLTDPAQRIVAHERLAALGFRLTFATRLLSEPPEVPKADSGSQPTAVKTGRPPS